MHKKLMATVSLAALSLGACQTTGSSNSTENVKANIAPPPMSQASVEMYKYKAASNKEQVAKIPEWYLAPPQKEGSIYAVGSAVTPDLQLSTDLAVLQAKTTLADRWQSQLKSQTKNFMAKVGSSAMDSSVVNEVERVTKNLVAGTDVSGYHMVKNAMHSVGPMFRSFVLLEYNDAQAAKILYNRMSKDRLLMNKLRSNEAFKELEENVKIEQKRVSDERKENIKAVTGG